MALDLLKALQHCFIQSLYNEGFINDEFYQVQAMKDTIGPDHVVRTVVRYCVSAQNLLSLLTQYIDQLEVDFQQVDVYARELYSKTTSIGAGHVKIACAELLWACEEKDKDYCSRVLYWTKNEYSQLRRKFETIVKAALGCADGKEDYRPRKWTLKLEAVIKRVPPDILS